ncbi:conserved oligomeric Golgi complex subunit 4-like, partial [Trifolium medium]|nr:conserved oligomeric Golgi complex subunit 4-like [Trifolium medium]
MVDLGKAISIDEHNLVNLATSMLDDVFLFYVLQSWLQRDISTSNVSSVVA